MNDAIIYICYALAIGYTPPGLLVMYIVFCQHERRGLGWLIWVVGLPAFALDVLANWTWCSLLVWQWPGKGQHTISQRCYYLQAVPTWRGALARVMVRLLNYFSVTPHIKDFKK